MQRTTKIIEGVRKTETYFALVYLKNVLKAKI